MPTAACRKNPDDVRINGAVTVDAFNASDAGNATQNFWRSAENLSVNTLRESKTPLPTLNCCFTRPARTR